MCFEAQTHSYQNITVRFSIYKAFGVCSKERKRRRENRRREAKLEARHTMKKQQKDDFLAVSWCKNSTFCTHAIEFTFRQLVEVFFHHISLLIFALFHTSFDFSRQYCIELLCMRERELEKINSIAIRKKHTLTNTMHTRIHTRDVHNWSKHMCVQLCASCSNLYGIC